MTQNVVYFTANVIITYLVKHFGNSHSTMEIKGIGIISDHLKSNPNLLGKLENRKIKTFIVNEIWNSEKLEQTFYIRKIIKISYTKKNAQKFYLDSFSFRYSTSSFS